MFSCLFFLSFALLFAYPRKRRENWRLLSDHMMKAKISIRLVRPPLITLRIKRKRKRREKREEENQEVRSVILFLTAPVVAASFESFLSFSLSLSFSWSTFDFYLHVFFFFLPSSRRSRREVCESRVFLLLRWSLQDDDQETGCHSNYEETEFKSSR